MFDETVSKMCTKNRQVINKNKEMAPKERVKCQRKPKNTYISIYIYKKNTYISIYIYIYIYIYKRIGNE